jgi:polysaccharide pyruvyl transferase WcaK-like protein
MRIGLFGLFGCGNSGNDASLESMIAFFRRVGRHQDLVCICPNPDRVEEAYGVPSRRLTPKIDEGTIGAKINLLFLRLPYRLHGVWHAIQEMRKLDVMIVPGTGFLDNFQDGPFGWPFMVFKWCFAGWLLRKKIVFVCIGAGPINHWLSRFFMKSAARAASYRSYRDVASKQFMQSIGVNVAQDNVFPDIVFSLAGPAPPPPSDGGFISVGVGVMSYFGWSKGSTNGEYIYRHYLEQLNAFVTWLLDNGFRVRLLTGDDGDWSAIQDLIEGMKPINQDTRDQVTAVRTHTLRELMAEIVKTDLVVVSRYHNLVSALKLGRPAISLEYSIKNRSLMAEMKLDDFCQSIETFDLDLLKQQFGKALEQRSDLRRQILGWNEEFATRLSTQEDRLIEFLFDRDSSIASLSQSLPNNGLVQSDGPIG